MIYEKPRAELISFEIEQNLANETEGGNTEGGIGDSSDTPSGW